MASGAGARAWWAWVAAMLLAAAGVAFLWLNRSTPDHGAAFIAGATVFAVACGTVGGLVTTRRPENRVGWLLSAGALLTAAGTTASGWATYALTTSPGSLPGGEAAVFGVLLMLPGIVLPLLFGTLLFPEGRLPSPRWRPVTVVAAAGLALAIAGTVLTPGPIEGYDVDSNPLGIEGAKAALEPVKALGFLLITVAGIAAIGSLVARLRRARGDERRQYEWFAFAAVISATAVTLAEALPYDWLVALQIAALPLLPAAVGVAILRYRLWGIDLIVNRSLVYAALTVCVAGAYAAVVGVLGALLQSDSDLLASLLATAVVAVLFQPLRERLQRRVNRLMYGERDDPYRVISRVGERLEAQLAPGAVLPAVAETVARALRLSSVSIEVLRDGRLVQVAAHGEPAGDPIEHDLSYRGELIGRMLVGPRAAGEQLSPADCRLLADLARQVGVAAHAVGLSADLQRSRERLVTAREEERRRLRRELHDGLGPTLAGVAMQLEAARSCMTTAPETADELLQRAEGEARAAVANVRSLAYDLRPPALDELGLVRALEERAAALVNGRGPKVSVRAQGEAGSLGAAVEVAAFRIAAEALANAVRHADAGACIVRIGFGSPLEVEVTDDGRGVGQDFRAGVGISSMRERAAELGGTCSVESLPGGGTRVLARLPAVAQ